MHVPKHGEIGWYDGGAGGARLGRQAFVSSICVHPLKVCSWSIEAAVVIEIVAALLKLKLLVPMSSLKQAVVKVD